MMLESRLRIAAALALGLAAGCSSVSQTPSAPAAAAPSARGTIADPEVEALLASACFECHAGPGRAPWYGALAPSYWFAGSARKTLDFAAWPHYDATRRAQALEAIEKAVREDDMPPWDYTLLDGSARLTQAQRKVLVDWAASLSPPTTAR